jgi:tetratricopeptide (TPR) repeat protein
MFEQLFSTMHDVLDEVTKRYDMASDGEKSQLDEQLKALRLMSDTCMDQWLSFEEKLAKFTAKLHPVKQTASNYADDDHLNYASEYKVNGFEKAQGFYKLYMFEQAVKELEALIQQHPDFLLARMYLAMGYLRLGEDGDAYRHFQLILPLTDDKQLQAISYNALGCLQVKKQNMQKAMEYFQLAYHADPGSLIEASSKNGKLAVTPQRLP